MIKQEPLLSVGIYSREVETRGVLNGRFVLPDKTALSGEFTVRPSQGGLVLLGNDGGELARGPEIRLVPEGNATFTLRNVTIGINFHWERKEDETFEGGLRILLNPDGTVKAVRVLSTTYTDGKTPQCIVGQLKRIRLPAAQDGREARVVVTIVSGS